MIDLNQEAIIKRDLVAAYLIAAKRGLDDWTYTHISARAGDGDSFYIYPFGLLFEEVTQDILLRVSLDGVILEGTESQYNRTGYIIHGNLYKARADVQAIFHVHTPATVAVSAMREGLLPYSQWALHFYGKVAYHAYNSLALDAATHGNNLIQDLGNLNVMLMENHGALTCGKTMWEAYFYLHHLEQACKVQSILAAVPRDQLIRPTPAVCEQTVHDLLNFEEDLGRRDWEAVLRVLKM